MSRSRVIRFGPGSLESVELRLWAKNRSYGSVICAEIRGSYTVYCGAGNTHAVRVDGTRECAHRGERTELGARILSAYDTQDISEAFDVATELVEIFLETWLDLCDIGEDGTT